MTDQSTRVNRWSASDSEVFEQTRAALEAGEPGVLATIVEVRGNAYRRPGAKMLIFEDGGGIGAVTAGCLEDEILELAADVREDGSPRVERFDLMGDDDVWGLGVGCNGVIDVLLEPLDASYEPAIEAFERGEDVAVLTVLESDPPDVDSGDRFYLESDDEQNSLDGDEPERRLVEELREPALKLAASGKSDTVELEIDGASVSVFVDGQSSPADLVVVGTGHDVSPLVDAAKHADFRVTVTGFRGGMATEERFPRADSVVSTSPARITEDVEFDRNTYVVVMTHNFVDDRLALGELVETPVPYIGLMGPTDRFERMLDRFETEDDPIDDSQIERIYTPIGLDLGGGSPYQIAYSIVAELLAVRNDRTPQHLRDRKGTIHERIELEV